MREYYRYRCVTCGMNMYIDFFSIVRYKGARTFWCTDCNAWKKFVYLVDGVIQVLDEVEL
jgi:formate dehydrogenase maturation protein FdhE